MSSAQPLAKPASYFGSVAPIKFEGLKSDNPLAFRYYNKDQIVLGKRMEDLLRPAVCYWHSFAWNGHDIFGQGTFDRPWNAGVMDQRCRLGQDGRGLRFLHDAGRAVLLLPRRGRDAGGCQHQGARREFRR